MNVLYDDLMPVHYGFIYLAVSDENTGGELIEEREGQINGLCGARLPGRISMMTGLHTGDVSFRLEWLPFAPGVDDNWEEIVEVSFDIGDSNLTLSSFQTFIPITLPTTGPHRARYSASGMDAGSDLNPSSPDEPAPDRYLLQLWPSAASPEAILRQTGQTAAYWHRVASGQQD